jgi:1,4-alpha-glucan branching enzyme
MAKRNQNEQTTQNQPTIPFELLAPYNEDVQLIGSWDGWKPTPMERDEKGVWRANVALPDGDHQYKFKLKSRSWFAEGEEVTISDPRAMQYTLDSRENSLVKVRDGARVEVTYEWQHDDVPLPANDQLVIYEMHIADFRGGAGDEHEGAGTFQSAIERLDYLAELGINAIELMPVNEFPGHHSWGYAQNSIYAVENSYGSPDDLCRFVDECHARGIRVIHDAVYNHMQSEAPLTKIDYEYWFYRDNPDEDSLRFGPKFNYEKHDETLDHWPAREHVIEAMRRWVVLFHIDGIRFDCTRALKYYDLLRWFHQESHSRANFKPFYTIAEHIPQDPTIAGAEGPMDAAWHDNFYRQVNATALGIEQDGRQPFNTDALFSVLDPRLDGFSASVNAVHYANNHDQERLMHLLGAAANTFDDAAFRRNKLSAALLLLSPGTPMLWMGEEFGQPTPKTLDPQPLQWGLLNNDRNRGLFEHYKHLIRLRKENPALYSNTFQPVANMAERGIIAFKRWNDQGNVVIVVANLKDDYAGQFEIDGLMFDDGTWCESIYNYEVQITNGVLSDTLAESEVKVYIKR